jgi:hypothetical protein
MLLVRVSLVSDAALQLHAAALLDDVSRLVRRGVQAWRARERDVIAGRVRLGTDRGARGCSGTPDVSFDAADIVSAEQALDPIEVRQRPAGAGNTLRRDLLDRVVAHRRGPARARGSLHGRLLLAAGLVDALDGVERHRAESTGGFHERSFSGADGLLLDLGLGALTWTRRAPVEAAHRRRSTRCFEHRPLRTAAMVPPPPRSLKLAAVSRSINRCARGSILIRSGIGECQLLPSPTRSWNGDGAV